MQPSGGEADASSLLGTVAVAAKVMASSGEAASSAGTVAAGVPEHWPKAKRSAGSRGETSSSKELGQGRATAAVAATGGSGVPRSSEQDERCSETPATSAQRQPVAAALCYYAVVAGSGTGRPSPSAAAAKELMKTPTPKPPLDYGVGESGAPSSVNDDAAATRPQAKRKGTGSRGSVGGNDEGGGSPVKRGPAAVKEKLMPISVEPGVQSGTRASSSKGAPRPFDLNLPCPLDVDDEGCPDIT